MTQSLAKTCWGGALFVAFLAGCDLPPPKTKNVPPSVVQNVTPAPAPKPTTPLAITAEEACRKIAQDPKGAEVAFNGRSLTVTGIVYQFPGYTKLFYLHGGGSDYVEIGMDPNLPFQPQSNRIGYGQTVTVVGKGFYLPSLDGLTVLDCKLVQAEPRVPLDKLPPCFHFTKVDDLLDEAAKGKEVIGELLKPKDNKRKLFCKSLIVEGVVDRLEGEYIVLPSPTGKGKVTCRFVRGYVPPGLQEGQQVRIAGTYNSTLGPDELGRGELQVSMWECDFY